MLKGIMSRIAGILFISLSLSSCSLLFTDYKEPVFPMVTSYREVGLFTGKSLEADYYTMFKDDYLTDAVKKALLNNYNLSVSYLNLQKALLYVDISSSDRHPSANASLGAQTKRALDYHDSTHKSSNSSLSLSYQLDLFGKIEAQNESAKEQYRASAYDYLAMRLTVIETTAKAYWQYAYAKEAVELGHEDLMDSEVRLKLVDSKFAAGAADSLDLDNARINHLKVKTTLEERYAELEKARTALDTVMGTTANIECLISRLDSAQIPDFSLDLPSSLLSKRPDLMRDEALLKEAYASYNQKKMAFFPDFTFTAAAGAGDTQSFARFLSNPVGTLGAAVTLPFLNFNKLNLERKSSFKDIEIAEANFVSDYIKAVQEVYDLVTEVKLYRTNLKTLKHAYALSVKNYQRYKLRYESGLVELTDFLSSADTMRNAKISYLMAKRNNLEATVSLMTALGGGILSDTDPDSLVWQ